MPDFRVYVLVRTDLPTMNPGKAMAQVHHTGVQMMALYAQDPHVMQYISDGIANGADGFNTTIALGATLKDIFDFEEKIKEINTKQYDPLFPYPYGILTDPSYPFFVENTEIANLIIQGGKDQPKIVKVFPDGRVLMVRPEITCAWFLIDVEVFPDFSGNLSLHP